jgi:hypothetical protein
MTIPFDDLFALRVVLQDEYDDETDIIYELKHELSTKGLTVDMVNKYLVDFYTNFGIDISEESIKSVQYPRVTSYRPVLLPPSNVSSTNILSLFTTLFSMPLNDIFSTLTVSGNIQNELQEPEDTPNQEHDSEEEQEIAEPMEDITEFPGIVSMRFTYNQQSLSNNLLQELNQLFNLPNQMNDVSVTLNENDLTKLEKFIPTSTLENKCSICINDMDTQNEVTRLPCKHEFHTECIEPWLKEYNYKCPVCRSDAGQSEAKI